jgi:branched-chain amino acid transport system permease protein
MSNLSPAQSGNPGSGLLDRIAVRHRPSALEALPWVLAVAAFFVFPTYLSLGTQLLVMVLFALSLDLALGYAGIVTLGHAAYFGLGAYTAGILNVRGIVVDPLLGLAVAVAVGLALGLLLGLILLRTSGLTFLMLTIAVLFMFSEAANKAAFLTGGADGLQGMNVGPVLGLFPFGIEGRTGYLYALAVLALATLLARWLVHSPFGMALTGMRENARRMGAIGAPVRARLVVVYALSAAMAAAAGALNAQVNQFVALNTLSMDLSGAVLVMLVLGGTGRFYGAFIGAPVYLLAEHLLSLQDPTYWLFWIGVMLVLIAMFAPGGILSVVDAVRARVAPRA